MNRCSILVAQASAFLLVTGSALAITVERHDLKIVHPGDPKERDIPVTLEQMLDVRGNPTGYATWVDSVICRDETCDVVLVRLRWDALGRFEGYAVEKGEDLTKLDHVPFTREEHAKLLRILKDKESPLREVTKEGLTGPRAKGVDGVSGATVLTLKENVVIGAGYTCYDLWHWVNGEMVSIIQGLSGKSFSENKLKGLLSTDDKEAIHFALRHASKRELFEAKTVDAVAKSMTNAEDELIEPALAYLRAAARTDAEFHGHVTTIFQDCSEKKRVHIISQLSKAPPPNATLERMSAALPSFTSHHELHRFLTLIESRNAQSDLVSKHVAELLNHRKFFVARRAFWFLEEQMLPEDLKKKVDAFYAKHEDRL